MLQFMMGNFEATFPTDRLYAPNHMWLQDHPSGNYRCGFTAYAVRLLQDVYFLEWLIDENSQLRSKQEIGSIESKKAESALYTPLPGRLVAFNEALLSDPSGINLDNYGQGWLFDLCADGRELLTPDAYVTHLEKVWEVTQRTIKGQMNE